MRTNKLETNFQELLAVWPHHEFVSMCIPCPTVLRPDRICSGGRTSHSSCTTLQLHSAFTQQSKKSHMCICSISMFITEIRPWYIYMYMYMHLLACSDVWLEQLALLQAEGYSLPLAQPWLPWHYPYCPDILLQRPVAGSEHTCEPCSPRPSHCIESGNLLFQRDRKIVLIK